MLSGSPGSCKTHLVFLLCVLGHLHLRPMFLHCFNVYLLHIVSLQHAGIAVERIPHVCQALVNAGHTAAFQARTSTYHLHEAGSTVFHLSYTQFS